MLTERGILCKVNSVMIPGINDKHLVEVNRAVKSRGAFLHNIMPLISAPEHGTVFGLNGQRGPDGARTEGVAGQLRRRDEHDAALPPMSRRRGGPARRRPLRGIHHGKDHGNGRFLRSRSRVKPIRTRSNKSVSPRSRRRTPNSRRSRAKKRATSRSSSPSPPRARAASTNTLATPRSSRSMNSAPRERNSSATAASTSIAKAVMARKTVSKR